LAERDRDQHDCRAEQLGDGERLVEQHPTGNRGDDRTQQAEQRHAGG
jgi:hypothetical protein